MEEGHGAGVDRGCKRPGVSSAFHQRPARAAGADAELRLLPHRWRQSAGQAGADPLSRERYQEAVGGAWGRRGDRALAWADFRMPIVSVDETAHTATLRLDR